ncbi:MAG: hypothetical protein EP335_15365 [Alphaproteobacteria bacterium]|nr:MAG: hypothetical protein EP335_15365 [Alphaproteobacteria bacterium]
MDDAEYERAKRGAFDKPFDLHFSSTKNRTFKDARSLADWLQEQLTALIRVSGIAPDDTWSEPLEKLKEHVQFLRDWAEDLYASGIADDGTENLLEHIRNIYDYRRSAVPIDGDQWFADLERAHDEDNRSDYEKLVNIGLRRYFDPTRQEMPVRTWNQRDLPTLAMSRNSGESMVRNLEHAFAELQKRVSDQENRSSGLQNDIGRLTDTQGRLDAIASEWQGRVTTFDKTYSAQLKRLEDNITARFEKENLEYATKFWTNKRDSHEARGWLFVLSTAAWLVWAWYILGDALAAYREHVMNASDIYDLVPYLPSNLLLIGVGVWGLRVLVRQILSENHLRTRAEEKVTLIETYIALMAEGRAEKDDRQIVLNSIFSHTQDGVIKDDGMPWVAPKLEMK